MPTISVTSSFCSPEKTLNLITRCQPLLCSEDFGYKLLMMRFLPRIITGNLTTENKTEECTAQ